MRKSLIFTIAYIICILIPNALYAQKKIAIIKSDVDDIHELLSYYGISYDVLSFKSLEKRESFLPYSIMFFPSGMEPPIESSLSVESRRTVIQSVKVKKNFYKINTEKVLHNINDFISSGGTAYFSGYSYKYIPKKLMQFSFHEKFPPMGMPGFIHLTHHNDIAAFCKTEKMKIHISVTGWVAVKDAPGMNILSSGSYDTPKGKRTGPITLSGYADKGFVLYTSYHSYKRNDFRRFNIVRLLGKDLLQTIYKHANRWEEKIAAKVIDNFLPWEHVRTYRFIAHKGKNTLYFHSKSTAYQIDILDSTMALIESVDKITVQHRFYITTKKKNELFYVKIYPDKKINKNFFAFVLAYDAALFPYFTIIIIVISIIGGLFALFLLYRVISGNKVFEY